LVFLLDLPKTISYEKIFSTHYYWVFITSCSIQKRQHLPGYHITFHKNYKSNSKEINQTEVIENEENELVNGKIIQHEVITLWEKSSKLK
jgi:hypothetical protein